MKTRKIDEMAADIIAFHVDRVLGLNLTPSMFGFVIDDIDTYRELFSALANGEYGVRVSQSILILSHCTFF